MGPRFKNPELLANGDLKVEGTFDTHGDVIGDVMVRFLIAGEGPGQTTSPILGTATLDHAALTRSSHPNGDVITHGEFSATVPNSFGVTGGEEVRGIGLAVALKSADPPDPPAFETFTWCVTLVVEAD